MDGSRERSGIRRGWANLRSLLWLVVPGPGGSLQHRTEFLSSADLAAKPPPNASDERSDTMYKGERPAASEVEHESPPLDEAEVALKRRLTREMFVILVVGAICILVAVSAVVANA